MDFSAFGPGLAPAQLRGQIPFGVVKRVIKKFVIAASFHPARASGSTTPTPIAFADKAEATNRVIDSVDKTRQNAEAITKEVSKDDAIKDK
jgi:hypothetical protein